MYVLVVVIGIVVFQMPVALTQSNSRTKAAAWPCEHFEQALPTTLTDRIRSFRNTSPSADKKKLQQFDNALIAQVENQVAQDQLLCHDSVIDIASALVAGLQQANSFLAGDDYLVLISKDPAINAFSIGYQTIYLNTGLLAEAASREELLFVIAHELAHDHLRHREKMLSRIVESYLSKSSEAEIESIIRTNTAKREALLRHFENTEKGAKAFSRKQELEADSLAILMIRNMKGDIGETIHGFNRLLSLDADSLAIDWSRVFHHEAFPFQAGWNYSPAPVVPPDTVSQTQIALFSTHPAIEDRVKYLHALQDEASTSVYTPSPFPEMLQHELRLLGIETLSAQKDYSRALFAAFSLYDQQHPDETVVTRIGQLMLQLYLSREKHEFEQVVPRTPFPVKSSYDRLVRILNNMRIRDISKAGYYFMLSHSFTSESYLKLRQSLFEKI